MPGADTCITHDVSLGVTGEVRYPAGPGPASVRAETDRAFVVRVRRGRRVPPSSSSLFNWSVSKESELRLEMSLREEGETRSRRTDRGTGRPTMTQTGRQEGKRTGRQTDRQKGKRTDRQSSRQKGKWTDRQADRQKGKRTSRQAEISSDGQRDRDRETDRHKWSIVTGKSSANRLQKEGGGD